MQNLPLKIIAPVVLMVIMVSPISTIIAKSTKEVPNFDPIQLPYSNDCLALSQAETKENSIDVDTYQRITHEVGLFDKLKRNLTVTIISDGLIRWQNSTTIEYLNYAEDSIVFAETNMTKTDIFLYYLNETNPLIFDHLSFRIINIGNSIVSNRLLNVTTPRYLNNSDITFISTIPTQYKSREIIRQLTLSMEEYQSMVLVPFGNANQIFDYFNPLALSPNFLRIGFVEKIQNQYLDSYDPNSYTLSESYARSKSDSLARADIAPPGPVLLKNIPTNISKASETAEILLDDPVMNSFLILGGIIKLLGQFNTNFDPLTTKAALLQSAVQWEDSSKNNYQGKGIVNFESAYNLLEKDSVKSITLIEGNIFPYREKGLSINGMVSSNYLWYRERYNYSISILSLRDSQEEIKNTSISLQIVLDEPIGNLVLPSINGFVKINIQINLAEQTKTKMSSKLELHFSNTFDEMSKFAKIDILIPRYKVAWIDWWEKDFSLLLSDSVNGKYLSTYALLAQKGIAVYSNVQNDLNELFDFNMIFLIDPDVPSNVNEHNLIDAVKSGIPLIYSYDPVETIEGRYDVNLVSPTINNMFPSQANADIISNENSTITSGSTNLNSNSSSIHTSDYNILEQVNYLYGDYNSKINIVDNRINSSNTVVTYERAPRAFEFRNSDVMPIIVDDPAHPKTMSMYSQTLGSGKIFYMVDSSMLLDFRSKLASLMNYQYRSLVNDFIIGKIMKINDVESKPSVRYSKMPLGILVRFESEYAPKHVYTISENGNIDERTVIKLGNTFVIFSPYDPSFSRSIKISLLVISSNLSYANLEIEIKLLIPPIIQYSIFSFFATMVIVFVFKKRKHLLNFLQKIKTYNRKNRKLMGKNCPNCHFVILEENSAFCKWCEHEF